MNAYEVMNCETGECFCFRPVMYEDCMNPGNWKTIPAERIEENGEVIFRSAEKELSVSQEDLKDGLYSAREYQTEPAKPSRRCGCIPCSNCGQCGW